MSLISGIASPPASEHTRAQGHKQSLSSGKRAGQASA
jgi:hypothetical protein